MLHRQADQMKTKNKIIAKIQNKHKLKWIKLRRNTDTHMHSPTYMYIFHIYTSIHMQYIHIYSHVHIQYIHVYAGVYIYTQAYPGIQINQKLLIFCF